jgi:hypothetical protein
LGFERHGLPVSAGVEAAVISPRGIKQTKRSRRITIVFMEDVTAILTQLSGESYRMASTHLQSGTSLRHFTSSHKSVGLRSRFSA